MPAIHDIECEKCGKVDTNHFFRSGKSLKKDMPKCCGIPMVILWSKAGSIHGPCHPSETIAIWENPRTGETRYPARNDIPIPSRYAAQGFIRREVRNLRDVQKLEKEKNIVSEIAHFDRGSGRGMEDYERRSRFR